jgi:hypothetical protein
MNQSSRRYWGLIMLAAALCLLVPATGATKTEIVVRPAAALPSPSPAPQPRRETKPTNAVRRFFTWTIDQITKPFRKQSPITCVLPPRVDISSSKSLITFCPTMTSSSNLVCAPDREVKLVALAPESDAENQFLFTWSATGGRLRGDGREVTWDLSGLSEGAYTAVVELNDGNQHTANAATTVTIALCPGCDRPPPLCPTISVSCPSEITGQPIMFEAIVAGGDPELKPAYTYTWSITGGKIISGQGTSKLRVDISDLGSQSMTATAMLGGAHPACSAAEASCALLRGETVTAVRKSY